MVILLSNMEVNYLFITPIQNSLLYVDSTLFHHLQVLFVDLNNICPLSDLSLDWTFSWICYLQDLFVDYTWICRLQVLLGVDYSVMLFHGREQIQRYLLTLMNIVGPSKHTHTHTHTHAQTKSIINNHECKYCIWSYWFQASLRLTRSTKTALWAPTSTSSSSGSSSYQPARYLTEN